MRYNFDIIMTKLTQCRVRGAELRNARVGHSCARRMRLVPVFLHQQGWHSFVKVLERLCRKLLLELNTS